MMSDCLVARHICIAFALGHLLTVSCLAFSQSSPPPSTSVHQPSGFLAKTKETFKLAELQHLEAKIQADYSGAYNITRLLLDSSTGSTLFQLSGGLHVDILASPRLPSSLQRCDWLAQIIHEGTSPENLIERIRKNPPCLPEGWILDYNRLEQIGADRRRKNRQPLYSKQTLLCAVAQCLPSRPAIDPKTASNNLIILSTHHLETGDEHFYLLLKLALKNEDASSVVASKWKQRPFQYSSAINFSLAVIVVDLLNEMVQQRSNSDEKRTKRLLDPTCGSGTFLALAIERGFQVEGCDNNEKAVKGTVANLVSIFGKDRVEKEAEVYQHDSSRERKGEEEFKPVDCVVANLPWGLNSIEYADENQQILQSIRSRIKSGMPCIFITKQDLQKEMKAAGFDPLDDATVPQRDFTLPLGKKGKSVADERTFRNQCIITVAVAR